MKELLYTHISDIPNVNYTMRVYRCDQLPPHELVTAAAVFAFTKDGKLAVANEVDHEDWDILGGHIEGDESPQECVIREAREEGGVIVSDLHLLGYFEYEAHSPNPHPSDQSYPYPLSYLPLFAGRVTEILDFTPNEEDLGRDFYTLDQVKPLPIYQKHQKLYEAARELAGFVN